LKSAAYSRCRIHLGESLFAALQALEASGLGIVLVEGPSGRLAGTLTDGDLRRALLKGAALDAPVDAHIQEHFLWVGPSNSRAEVLDLMQSRRISQIPIVDPHGHLVGLHTLPEILGASPRPNWAVIMAGGRGERLRPLTDTIPKPMVRVAGRPILERIVLHFVGQGFRTIFLSVNYMSEVIERHFGDGGSLGCEIRYLREKEPLGTGGALSLLPRIPGEPLLVVNGDLLTQFDAASMLLFHDLGSYEATIGIHEYSHTVPFGVVDLEGDRVTQLREKPSEVWLANAGIYVLEPALLARVPRDTYFPIPALVEECLGRGEAVGAFRIEEEWADVGLPQELRRARGEEDRP
jgi:dTDP-glucose pyrophosphorylase